MESALSQGKTDKAFIAGWVISVLAVLPLILSASGKLMTTETAVGQLAHIGYPATVTFGLGLIESLVILLYLFPRTSILGAILSTGYMGGAIASHLRIGEPVFVQLTIGVLFWIGLGLRDRAFRTCFLAGLRA